MPQCTYHDICGRDVEGNLAHGLCILHSTDAVKDARAFDEALALHRKSKGDNFFRFVFPGEVDFNSARFAGDVDFTMATFTGHAGFNHARFAGESHFRVATFRGDVDFIDAEFTGFANFDNATFSGRADFIGARFAEKANFSRAMFRGGADFTGARFAKEVNFFCATFLGKTLFRARGQTAQPAPAEYIWLFRSMRSACVHAAFSSIPCESAVSSRASQSTKRQ
jgi:Pentapeptide repeats (9 copies)